MQHIEDAGIHSGDSACVLPPYLVGERDLATIREQTIALAKALGVVGLINVQFAIKHGTVYVLEVNPRASRTVPFVSKAIGVPLASLAARAMLGETLEEIGFTEEIVPPYVSVKEAVFPFSKFAGIDPVLGPEMRSTGEVMGIADSFGQAFAKAQLAAGNGLPLEGAILITVNDNDKANVTPIARRFHEMGFKLYATERHRAVPARPGHPVRADAQDPRGAAELLRPDRQPAGPPARQHAVRQARAARRLHDAPGGHPPPHPVHHDAVGGRAPPATPSSRCGPGRPACARCRNGRRCSALAAGRPVLSFIEPDHDRLLRARIRLRRRRRRHRRRQQDLALLPRPRRRRDRRALHPRPERGGDERRRASATT